MIKARQVNKELTNIVNEILRNGSLPYYKQVMNKLRKSLQSFIPGEPKFFPKLIEPYSVSNPKEINDMFNFIYEDMKTIVDENNYQSEKLLSVLNYYYIEINKIIIELEDKNLRLDNIKNNIDIIRNGNIIYENFESFEKIDFEGDFVNDLLPTNCLVDLRQHKAYNWRQRNKVDISKAEYKLEGNVISNIHDFSNCLRDVITDSWIASIESNNNKESISINVNLKEEVEASCIQIKSLIEKNINMELYILQGSTYMHVNESPFSNKYIEFNFRKTKIKGFKLIYTKMEPDSINGVNTFYFGIQNISVFSDNIFNEQRLLSKRFAVTNISSLKLETETIIYPYSDIIYSVIFEKDDIVLSSEVKPNSNAFNIPDDLLDINNRFSGHIRINAIFYNSDHSPQLLSYKIILGGEQYA